ncbi:MAG TPA: hypothetical protein VGP99_12325 [Tepidisphaeraceae bacterium]|nr:hypothetical protein [Tepidisphaeraceae bacterium]
MRLRWLLGFLLSVHSCSVIRGEDHFLTIGGGESPTNNQVSLEKNILYLQRFLSDSGLGSMGHDIYFANGKDVGRDIQFVDPRTPPPRVNALLAQIFDREENLDASYRAHSIPGVRGAANRSAIGRWFETTGPMLHEGDRLFIYFSGHGGAGKPARNTTLALWGEGGMPVKEFVGLLDKIDPKVQVILIMVQCHAGGFADVIFKDAQAGTQMSSASRCGFFATSAERMAAGCTSDIDEDNYREYSTYFWAALYGRTRTGQAVRRPDYDGDGHVSLCEAHAYVQITSDTIDIPVATSDIFLRSCSKAEKGKAEMVNAEDDVDALLGLARPEQRAVIEELSKQLELKQEGRMVETRALADKYDKERKGLDSQKRKLQRDFGGVRGQIQSVVKQRWPELSNPWHPKIAEILKKESDDVVKTIESHPKFKRFDDLSHEIDGLDARNRDLERKWVKCQRLMQTLQSVALAGNLEKVATPELQEKYKEIVRKEGLRLEAK